MIQLSPRQKGVILDIIIFCWYICLCCAVGGCSATTPQRGYGWAFGAFIFTPLFACLFLIVLRLSEDK